MPRSRSFTRLSIRVGLEHLGQSVLLLVSIIFLRSPVLAIFAIVLTSPVTNLVVLARASTVLERPYRERNLSSHDFPWDKSKEKNRGENLDLVYTIRRSQATDAASGDTAFIYGQWGKCNRSETSFPTDCTGGKMIPYCGR